MSSYYYFHGTDADKKAREFADGRGEFKPEIYRQPGRIVVKLTR